jgi:hypothetical protein
MTSSPMLASSRRSLATTPGLVRSTTTSTRRACARASGAIIIHSSSTSMLARHARRARLACLIR